MEDFDFETYDFNAPPVQHQQNNPATEETEDLPQGLEAGATHNEFNIDTFMNLSDEELNRILNGDLTNDQQLAIEASALHLSTQADERSATIRSPVHFGPGDGHNENTDGYIATGEGGQRDAVLPTKENSDQETQRMDNGSFMNYPVLEGADFNQDGSTNPPWRQPFNALEVNTFRPSQFQSVSAEKPRNRDLSGQNPMTEHSMPRNEGVVQHSAFTNPQPNLYSGLRPEGASTVQKNVSHTTPRRRLSTSEFWQTYTAIIHPTRGTKVRGTFYELLRYPELEQTIKMQFAKWKRKASDTRRKAATHRKNASGGLSQRADPAIGNANYAAGMISGAGVQQTTMSPFQMPVDGAAQSPSALNMSGLQVHSPAVYSHGNVSAIAPRLVVVATAEFDLEHQSIDAALEYIERPPAVVCERLNIEGDDWEDLAEFSAEFRLLCQELFEALQRPGGDVPDYFNDQQMQNYTKNHEKVHALVLELMGSPEQISEAKARVIKAMHEVVRVHQTGISKAVLQIKTKARGYEIDKESTCRHRAQKVIDNTRACKYIALDILKSKNLADLARSPDQYLAKKYGNSKGNKHRGDDLRDMRALKKGQKTADEVLGGRISAVSSPAPQGFYQRSDPFDTASVAPQSPNFLIPGSYGSYNPGHQGRYFAPAFPHVTHVARGRKRGRTDGEDEDGLQGMDRYGKGPGTHDGSRPY